MASRYDVLIVGAGHAGANLAAGLRRHKFRGSIGLLGDEPDVPYERPPLSKEYFTGDKPFEKILIRPPQFWPDNEIELVRGVRATGVDPQAGQVSTDDGRSIAYGTLAWAAGGSPKKLPVPGAGLDGVHELRTRADADIMKAAADSARQVVVIGGGYIGLEAAAALRKLGKRVVVLEALPRVLSRVAGEQLSSFFEQQHRGHGVDVRVDVGVEAIEGERAVTGVRLTSGEVIPAELVVVGIGIVPEIGPLEAAGAAVADGVRVDEFCRTSLPAVYAIGDCAAHVNRYAQGREVRLESVQNAADMALSVARTIADGIRKPYDAVPWFWSNQYDLRLQTVGLSSGFEHMIVRGDPGTASFSVIYLLGGRVIALDCVNNPRDYVQGKALITSGAVVDERKLADAGTPLREIAAGGPPPGGSEQGSTPGSLG